MQSVQSFIRNIQAMTSFTITFSNTASSVLQSFFLPEIMLDGDHDYSCAFLDLFIKTKQNADLTKIIKSNVLRINCDMAFGSYINGKRTHVIHQFAPSASYVKDQILVETPKNLNYFPIKSKNLHSIQISVVDNTDGNLIDIHGADIICRISIKRDCIQHH